MNEPIDRDDIGLISRGTRIFSGTLLHADLTGFTSLAERLGSHGKAGTEQLTGILNASLAAILQPIREAGGVVLYFAGDSVTARLPDPSLAAGCAAGIHSGLNSLGPVDSLEGPVQPAAAVTTATGRWGETVLSRAESAHILLSGPLVSRLADLEREAGGRGVTTSTRLYVPPVIDQPSAGQSTLKRKRNAVVDSVAEHRSMAAIFVRLFGYDPARPPIAELQTAYAMLADVTAHYGGTVALVDSVVADGCRVFLLFGAPVSTGRDARNAVLAGAKALEKLKDLRRINAGIGVGYGYAYAGVVGDEWKRTYTVIGDSVNTAARLADTAAPGSIVVTDDVRRVTVAEFGYDELSPVMARGKSRALRRFVPGEEMGSDARRYAFVGRGRELSRLTDILSTPGSWVELTGEAGIGKTRLLEELTAGLKSSGHSVVLARPEEPRGVDEHLACLLFDVCGIRASDPSETKRSKLRSALQQAGGERLASLESIPGRMLLGIEYSDAPYHQLTPRIRRVNLMECLRSLVRALGPGAVVMVDDAHLLSDEEADELASLLGDLVSLDDSPASALICRRPEGPAVEPSKGPPLQRMELSGLDDRSRRGLLRNVALGCHLEPEVERTVMERAQGNPFYLLQMVLYLVEKGLLVRQGDRWTPSSDYSAESLPENVFAMVMARIDRLSSRAKECLRVGSVIGMEFPADLVASVVGRSAREEMGESVSAGLLFAAALKELEYIFSHMLIRDVAYDSMLREKRRALHHQVAELLERQSAPAAILAHHYQLAEDWNRALQHMLSAGDRASEEYRNQQAISHFRRAAEIAAELDGLQVGLSRARLSEGAVLDTLGRYDQALQAYEEVVELKAVAEDWGRAMQGKAQIHFVRGEFEKALGIMDQAEAGLEGRAELEDLFTVRFAAFRAWVQAVKGDLKPAMENATAALAAAEALEEDNPKKSNLLGYACNTLATVHWAMNEMDKAADLYRRALGIAQAMGSRREAAVTIGNIGLVLEKQGRYDEAIEAIEGKLEIVREIGDLYMVNSCHGELVPCMLRAGRIREAGGHCRQYIDTSRELVSTHDLLIGLGLEASIALRLRDLKRVRACAGELENISVEKGIRREEWKAYMYHGWIAMLEGNPVKAGDLLRKAIDLAREIEPPVSTAKLMSLIAWQRALVGEWESAEALLDEARQIAVDLGPVDRADILLGSGRACIQGGIWKRGEDALREAGNIYRAHGALADLADTEELLGILIAERDGKVAKEASEHLSTAARIFDEMSLGGRASAARNYAPGT